MHSVGIRRAFWTNENGLWESGKVRDLVDAFDRSTITTTTTDCGFENGGYDVGAAVGNGVFVTKHEVLMLRRLMGDG